MEGPAQGYSFKKWTIIIIFDLLLVTAIILFFGVFRPFSHSNIKIDGVFLDYPRDVADFNLVDQHGRPYTKQQLKGHWTLLFFGFTHCRMICPTTLEALNKMYLMLEKKLPAHLLPQAVFISIDPKNDTISRLNEYVSAYNSHFIGARTDLSSLTSLKKSFTVTAATANGIINHTTDILLLNPKAQIQAYFLYPHRARNLARDYQVVINVLKQKQ